MIPDSWETKHRPWPVPARSCRMFQTWHDLLFAHWPLPASMLAPQLPEALELDLYEGTAWIAVVPFRMSGIRLRGLPPVPGASAFPECNVRTYVRPRGSRQKPGVYFFSLEATNRLAIAVARAWFHLPYFRARMRCRREGEEIEYVTSRRHRGAPGAEFRGRYGPTAPAIRARPGTLEHWLTERYCLYTVDRRGRTWRGEIHHDPWPLQPAEAEIETNQMVNGLGLELPAIPPLLHFCRRLDVAVWALEEVGEA